MVRKYVRGLTPQKKAQVRHSRTEPLGLASLLIIVLLKFQLKFVTSCVFKGKKDSYPQSVAQPFMDTRISEIRIGCVWTRAH